MPTSTTGDSTDHACGAATTARPSHLTETHTVDAVNRDEAAAEAARRNRDLGMRGEPVGIYTAVERAPGEWGVDFREQRPHWISRLVQRLIEALPR
jgi:hypothetical protein